MTQLANSQHRPVPHEEGGIGRSRIDAGAVSPAGRADVVGVRPAEGVVAKHWRGARPDGVVEASLVRSAAGHVNIELKLLQERARVTFRCVRLGRGGRRAIVGVASESSASDVIDLAIGDIAADMGQVVSVPRAFHDGGESRTPVDDTDGQTDMAFDDALIAADEHTAGVVRVATPSGSSELHRHLKESVVPEIRATIEGGRGGLIAVVGSPDRACRSGKNPV